MELNHGIEAVQNNDSNNGQRNPVLALMDAAYKDQAEKKNMEFVRYEQEVQSKCHNKPLNMTEIPLAATSSAGPNPSDRTDACVLVDNNFIVNDPFPLPD